MNDAKLRHKVFLKISMAMSSDEKKYFEEFFQNHPSLKKGETVKIWILNAIANYESIESNKTQVDIGVL